MAKSIDFAGLSEAEVSQREALGQTNYQSLGTSRTVSNIIFANLFTLFNAVVGGSFLLLLIIGEWQDALFGLAVIANIIIGVTQELLARSALDRLSISVSATVLVIREGKSVEIPNAKVVLGDLLNLKPGDVIPSDSKLLQTKELEIDESLLTGESEPVTKEVGETILSGTSVVAGGAVAEVIRVGEENYTSKLVREIRRYQLVNSEIRNDLNRVVKWISWALLPTIAIASFGQIGATTNLIDGIVSTVAGVISMVPQGLVLITSIAFAVSATTLARKKVLVQELAAVEILARVDVVCFDKTGTLTKGSMSFHSEHLLEPIDETILDWKNVLGHFANDERANATAQALRQAFQSDTKLEEVSLVPFSSSRKWSSFSFRTSGKEIESWVLGAPEYVLEPNQVNQKALKNAESLAGIGNRTLVLGFSKKPIIGDALPLDVVPVVILCFREQLKPSISKTLSYLIQQGVSIRILSGDNPRTVAMVAKDAGVETTEEGFDARELPSDLLEIGNILEKTVLLGRVTPEQKKLIVQSLQKNGHVVAMVGDGVNDALALKQSDLGIAMGSGASSTRQVANLILADSNFDNLPLVIAEGRRVIANIERVSRLFLTKTVWAWSLTVVFGLLYWSFPFLPRQVAAIDAFTIGIPAFLLALLPNSEMYRAGFLRRVLKFAIPSGLITATAVITLVYLADEFFDFRENEIQTAVSILLSISGLWILGTLIRPLNFVRILILALMVLVMITLFQWPMALMFFSLTVLTSIQIWPVFLISFLTIVLIEISNQVTKTQKH